MDPEKTLAYGMAYLRIMIPGLLPFALVQSYAGTLRETGETMLPMKAGIVSVLVNLMLNYLLIFGKFGCPKLGAEGAAVATVTAVLWRSLSSSAGRTAIRRRISSPMVSTEISIFRSIWPVRFCERVHR